MIQYKSYEEILDVLRHTPKGKERADIIANKHNRSLVLNSGANVTLFAGERKDGLTIKEQLRDVHIGLIERLNARTGSPEGIGAVGGLSERISEKEFSALNLEQQTALVGLKDDVVLDGDNFPAHTQDINVIRKNTVAREMFEEFGNLGIYDFKINPDKLHLVEMPDVKDDNYLINLWNGGGNAWAITPYCHTLEVSAETLDELQRRSLENSHEANSEAKSYKKIPLFEALSRWGKPLDADKDDYNYRYPHEWMAAWSLASDMLGHDRVSMMKLMAEVQKSSSHLVSIKNAVKKMGHDLTWTADVLKVSADTAHMMDAVANNLYNYNNPSPVAIFQGRS